MNVIMGVPVIVYQQGIYKELNQKTLEDWQQRWTDETNISQWTRTLIHNIFKLSNDPECLYFEQIDSVSHAICFC